MARLTLFVTLVLAFAVLVRGQGVAPFQTDFPADEFAERRAKIMDAIGSEAIAIVQGAPGVDGFKVFRQSNEFYYLTGLESPHAYLVLDGRNRRTTLYLSRRNEALERSTGTVWSAEDDIEVRRLTGVDAVRPSNGSHARLSARCSGRPGR
jgi:Xaa-Pro aminopeptidase